MERKRAIVTGAGTGIGQGVAIMLGRSGYDVAVHYNSSAEGAVETCRAIEKEGGRAFAIQADLSRKEGIDSLFEKAEGLLGGLDLYVNNSGITRKSDFLETSEAFYDEMMNTDLKSAYFCVQAAAKSMAKNAVRGSIVIVCSNNALQQRPNLSVYGTIKAALVKLTKHAAMELAKYGIRVNAIAPGWTATPRTLLVDVEGTYPTIPLKRWSTPEEIGGIALFLASDVAASITGNCIVADGGAVLMGDPAEKYGL